MPEASTVPSAGASSWNFREDEPELMTRTRVSSAVSVMGGQLLGQRSVFEGGGGGGRFRLGLDGGDDDGVDDVVDESSTGEVVDRLVQALQDGADGDRPGRALDRLVGVVARVEVGEDEDGRPAGDRGLRQL